MNRITATINKLRATPLTEWPTEYIVAANVTLYYGMYKGATRMMSSDASADAAAPAEAVAAPVVAAATPAGPLHEDPDVAAFLQELAAEESK